MADNDRHFERYLTVFVRWGSPEELDKVLRCGTPEELTELLTFAVENRKTLTAYLALLEEISQERRDRARLRSAVGLLWTLVWKIGLGVGAGIGLWNTVAAFGTAHGWWQ